MSELVTPDVDMLGIRVTGYTPLAKLVGVLRRLNPDAPYADLKAAAERMRQAKPAAAAEPEPPAEVKPAKRRRLKTEADASLVPVEGGKPIPAEPPVKW